MRPTHAVAALAALAFVLMLTHTPSPRSSPPTPRLRFPSPPVATVDLFIRTYPGDAHWLVYLLRSMERHLDAAAYRTIHVVTDAGDDAAFIGGVVALFPRLRARVVGQHVERWMTSHNNGSYHAQMLSKLTAGDVAAGADVVCYFDSDNLLTGPVGVADFVRGDGAVGVAPLPFSNLTAEREAWQPGCEALLQMPCEYETMTGFPICYPVSLFADFTKHVLQAHNASSLTAVLKTLPNWNEFTPLGAFLMHTRPQHGLGGWYVKPQVNPHVVQAWSWGGFDPAAVVRWETLLRKEGGAC